MVKSVTSHEHKVSGVVGHVVSGRLTEALARRGRVIEASATVVAQLGAAAANDGAVEVEAEEAAIDDVAADPDLGWLDTGRAKGTMSR
jgi:hypothetical protein